MGEKETDRDLPFANQTRIESTLRAMHDIQTASREIGFASQVRGILEIGIRQLGLPVGLVSRLDGDQISLPYVVGGEDDLPEGTVVRACDSFCGESIARRSLLVIENTDESEFRDHPGNTVLGIKAYVGQPIYVDDVIWGTVCFLDTQPRGRRFTPVDLDLFELICQRVQVGIEHEAVLTGFRAVLSGTASVTGDGLFRSLVAALCRGVGADTAWVAERVQDHASTARARTLAVWRDGALAENFEYSTQDTPSEDLAPRCLTCYPDEVQRRFPDDSNLTRLNVRGYVGIGLEDHAGQPLGHLVAFSKQRLDLRQHERWLVEILAGRASGEFERIRADAEQLRLEREMLHGEKLKSLGVLAGGIAHDFNNLLTGIVGNVGLIQMDAPPGSDLAELAARIETASERAKGLTKQMLSYSGRGAFTVKPLDLNATVKDVAALLDSAVSKNVVLQRTFAEDLPLITADDTQVRQVLMNLIMNASDALEENSGAVSLRTGFTDVRDGELRDYFVSDQVTSGRFVFIEVEDAGVGMDEETQRKMFDPFFTTKTSGSGLGLSAALGIVKGHHGGIQVRSEVGVGTRIRVLFPAASHVTLTEPRPAKRTHPVGVGGTALVVDDEEVVRGVGSEILRRSGMSVIAACDGVEAVEEFTKHQSEIGVVLLDLSMPRMDGYEAAKRIRQIDPAAIVILMSGYPETRHRFKESACSAFLPKPFSAESLLDTVTRLVRPKSSDAPEEARDQQVPS